MESSYLALLGRQNVWWDGKIENDPHILQWKEHEQRWIPHQLEILPHKPFSLNIVIGPRQAGKTTLIKLAVEKLLKSGINPKSILYARCDEVLDAKQLREVIETFFAYSGSKESFIFLDEITDIDGWEKVMKGFIDDGDFKKTVVTVSGSNAYQLQKGAELFPGRRGNGKDIYMLPLNFREYLAVVDKSLIDKIPQLTELDSISVPDIRTILPMQNELQKHLHDYLQCGGFPLAVLSYLKERKVSEEAKETYKSWIIGDILKNGKSDQLAREVLKVVLSKTPTPVSWEGIAQETTIKSPPTLSSYIELFERLFFILPLYALKPDKGTKEFAKNKKLHLFDPFLYHLSEEWCMQQVEHKEDVIAEAVLATHIARFLAAKYGAYRVNDYVGYWKNGYEIDVVAQTKKGLSGFEMKWSDRKGAFEFKAGPIKNQVYISKNTFREGRPLVIPLAVLLSML